MSLLNIFFFDLDHLATEKKESFQNSWSMDGTFYKNWSSY